MTMITPSYLGETIEYSSLHACRSTLEDPTWFPPGSCHGEAPPFSAERAPARLVAGWNYADNLRRFSSRKQVARPADVRVVPPYRHSCDVGIGRPMPNSA